MSFGNLQDEVITKDLCMQCGGCYVACPKDLIKIGQNGKVVFLGDSDSDCGNCTDCLESCPGQNPDTVTSELKLYNLGRKTEERWTGKYTNLLAGKSTNPDLFANSASGGSVTSVLASAMQSLSLDFVVTAGRDPEEPWKGKPSACNTEKELLSRSQATYQLFPYLWIIKDLLRENPQYKIGVVGLACHIQALRKLQRVNNYWGELVRSQVLFTAEIACSSNTLSTGTETLITEIMGIPLSEVRDVKYRHGDYPGSFAVFTKDGTVSTVPFWRLVEHFKGHKSHRCLTCGDWMSGLADVSVCDGDANIYKTSKNIGGGSNEEHKFGLIFIRSTSGQRVVDVAVVNGSLETQEVPEFDQDTNLGFQRKKNRRATWEQVSGAVIPTGPIAGYHEEGAGVSDDQVISDLSD